MSRPREAGFTLIELMVTVAMVGILAAIALPSFAGTARKSKGDTEVNAMFGELRIREEQYQLEYGRYVSTGSGETSLFPSTPGIGKPQALGAMPATWSALRVRAPEKALCSYVVIAGTPSDLAGAQAGSFGFVQPAKNWFYILARCNLDGNSATDAYYFTSSEDPRIQKLNPGR